MILSRIEQLELEDVLRDGVDLVLAASGYEARSTHLAKKIGRTGQLRVSIGFKEFHQLEQRKANDNTYQSLGYEQEVIAGGASAGAGQVLASALATLGGPEAVVLVDISSMTRSWYGGIVRALRFSHFPQRLVRVIFGYVPAAFESRLGKYPQNRYVEPVPGFTGLALPTMPTALVVGLGQDHGRALGIHAEIDPGVTASFLASPGTDKRYEPAVRRANAQFLELVDPEYQFDYPLLDFTGTFFRLRDVTSVLADKWCVVMAALGPKIFALACFLVATELPSSSVWRVSAGERVQPVDRRAGRSLILAATEWCQSEDEH